MIAPAIHRADGERKRRSPQVVEVRVVVELQLPAWLQAMQPSGSELRSQTVVIQNVDPFRGRQQEENGVPDQDVSGSAFFVTSSETQPAVIQRTSTQSPSPAVQTPGESLVDLYDRLLSEQDAEKRVRVTTIRSNRSFLAAFQVWTDTYLPKNDPRTTIPRVGFAKRLEIPGILKEYSKHLRSQGKGNSESMCTKALAAIGKLSGACQRAGLISARPEKPSRSTIKMLRPRTEAQRRIKAVPVTVDELRSMLSVVDGCTWPELGHVSAAKFWETCLLSHYCYGFRSQDWFAVRDQFKRGLLWSGVITDPQCPGIEDLQNEHGWISYLVHKTDTKDELADRPSDVLMPLSKRMRQLIEQFRGLDPVRVFPLPSTHKSYDREFLRILDRAGLSDSTRESAGKPIIRLSLGQRNVASFRKGSSAMWAKAVGRAASSYVLHHAVSEEGVSKTTTDSYLQHEDLLREIVPALETLPIW